MLLFIAVDEFVIKHNLQLSYGLYLNRTFLVEALEALLHYMPPSPICYHTHAYTKEHIEGNVGFGVLPKATQTCTPGKPESNYQSSKWWTTALPPEVQLGFGQLCLNQLDWIFIVIVLFIFFLIMFLVLG